MPNTRVLNTLAKRAGIAGITVGVFLILFRDFIRQTFFPQLAPIQGYNLLLLFVLFTFAVAIAGLVVWAGRTQTGKMTAVLLLIFALAMTGIGAYVIQSDKKDVAGEGPVGRIRQQPPNDALFVWDRLGSVTYRIPAGWTKYAGGSGRAILTPSDARPPTPSKGVPDVAIIISPEVNVDPFAGDVDAISSQLINVLRALDSEQSSGWHSEAPFLRATIGDAEYTGVAQEGTMTSRTGTRTVIARRLFYFKPPRWLCGVTYAASNMALFSRYRATFDSFIAHLEQRPSSQ